MKIIHIVHGKANPNSNNGISRVVYYLNKYERLAGIDSQIWAIVDGVKKTSTYKRDDYVTVECFPRVTIWGGHDIIKRLESEKDSINLVHFHLIWFYDKNIIMNAVKKLKIHTVITTHGTYSKPHAYTGKRKIARWLFERKYLNMADECHILTPEEGTGLRRYGYTGKSFVAYNGFDPAEMPNLQNTQFFKDDPFANRLIISTVSVLRKDKNTDLIIKALSLLPEEERKQVIFVLIGPDYKSNAMKYKRLAESLKVTDAFYWTGPLYNQDKYDAMASSDCYIMASDSEGFSMAIIDAMASALPMILTSGCNMKYISDEKFYIMCEPYPQHIADAISKFLSMSVEQRNCMGIRAKHILEEQLYWNKIIKGLIENYQRIITK